MKNAVRALSALLLLLLLSIADLKAEPAPYLRTEYAPGKLLIQFRAKPLKSARARRKPLRMKDYLAFRKRLFRDVANNSELKLDDGVSLPFKNLFGEAVSEIVTKNLREWQLKPRRSRGAVKEYGIAESFIVYVRGDPLEATKALKKQRSFRLRDHFGTPLEIRSVSPDYRFQLSNLPAPVIREEQWSMAPFRVAGPTNPWSYSTGNRDTIVAVIDSGVDLSHEALRSNLVPGYDFVDNDPVPEDAIGHGTHVAGIIAASRANPYAISGVCPDCTIMPLKVCGSRSCDFSAVSQAIRYAADHDARVINMSLGGYMMDPIMGAAIDYARTQQNVIVVAAAGNDNTWQPSYPASYPDVISVGALDRDYKKASYSNWGRNVDIMAPGSQILSSVPAVADSQGLTFYSGTSMASPYVAGVAALMVAIHPDWLNTKVEEDLIRLTERSGTYSEDYRISVGSVSPRYALGAAFGVLRPTPTPITYNYRKVTFPFLDDFSGDGTAYPSNVWDPWKAWDPREQRWDEEFLLDGIENVHGWGLLCDPYEVGDDSVCRERSKFESIMWDGMVFPEHEPDGYVESLPEQKYILRSDTVEGYSFEVVARVRQDVGLGTIEVCANRDWNEYDDPGTPEIETSEEDCTSMYITTPLPPPFEPDPHRPDVSARLYWNGGVPRLEDICGKMWNGELYCDYAQHKASGSEGAYIQDLAIKGAPREGYALFKFRIDSYGDQKSSCIDRLIEVEGRQISIGSMCLHGPMFVPRHPGQIRMSIAGGIELDYVYIDTVAGSPNLPPPTPTPLPPPVQTLIGPPQPPTATPSVTPTMPPIQTPQPTPSWIPTTPMGTPTTTATPIASNTPIVITTPTRTPSPTPTPLQDLLIGRVLHGNQGADGVLVFADELGVEFTVGGGYYTFREAVKGKKYQVRARSTYLSFNTPILEANNDLPLVFRGRETNPVQPAVCEFRDIALTTRHIANNILDVWQSFAKTKKRVYPEMKLLNRAYSRLLSQLYRLPTTQISCNALPGCTKVSYRAVKRNVLRSMALITNHSARALRSTVYRENGEYYRYVFTEMKRVLQNDIWTESDECR